MLILPILLVAADPPCADPHSNYGIALQERGIPVCPPPSPPKPQRAATAAEQKAVRAYFDEVLFDGPSARWKFTGRWKDGSVCGMVNAKNRLGAYTGWRLFAYRAGEGVITEEGDRLHWADRRTFDCILPNEPLGIHGF